MSVIAVLESCDAHFFAYLLEKINKNADELSDYCIKLTLK